MPLTPRQRATRLAQIRRIVMRMYPTPREAEPAEPAEEPTDEDEDEEPDVEPDAPQIVDMASLPPRAVDASLPW